MSRLPWHQHLLHKARLGTMRPHSHQHLQQKKRLCTRGLEEQVHTWDGLGEGEGRIEKAQGAREHAAALGQRHEAQEHSVARALRRQLWRVRDAQVPRHRLRSNSFENPIIPARGSL